MFGKDGRYLAEVASVWAEQAHRLGYLTVDRVLDADEWTLLTPDRLRERFDGKDVRRSDVEADDLRLALARSRLVAALADVDGHELSPDDGSSAIGRQRGMAPIPATSGKRRVDRELHVTGMRP